MRKTIAGLAFLLALAPATALTPRPPPPKPTPAQIKAYIACYPKVDRVRERYRAEVARLEVLHKKEIDLALGRNAPPEAGPPKPPDPHTFHRVQSEYVYGPASARVFLPVVKTCGFDTTLAYSDVGWAIEIAWKANDPVLAPWRAKVEGMLLPNLN